MPQDFRSGALPRSEPVRTVRRDAPLTRGALPPDPRRRRAPLKGPRPPPPRLSRGPAHASRVRAFGAAIRSSSRRWNAPTATRRKQSTCRQVVDAQSVSTSGRERPTFMDKADATIHNVVGHRCTARTEQVRDAIYEEGPVRSIVRDAETRPALWTLMDVVAHYVTHRRSP